ncbi:hypothetical protein POM88_030013 [Heracleum sosnowskyi]|uniref:Uncharacterized protein n=1 Tax=Heracleum sosnowskyi TaxID=360622 RepID=A0AAD8HV70_9APIA|nr:hypothetical protein POM88_030013 [Heracleum sosnowskyi]
MFTLCNSSPQSLSGFHKPHLPSIKFPSFGSNGLPHLSNFRPKVVFGMQVKQRLAPIFSTNSKSPEGDSVAKKPEGGKPTEESSGQGPPFLTILAGFVVLFLISKVFGSIITWLVGLIVNVPKPN